MEAGDNIITQKVVITAADNTFSALVYGRFEDGHMTAAGFTEVSDVTANAVWRARAW